MSSTSTRKSFIAAAASVPLIAAAPASPAPTAAGVAKDRDIAAVARALAERMRHFDSRLSDEDLTRITKGILQNLEAGRFINKHGQELKNWDEPVTVFEVEA